MATLGSFLILTAFVVASSAFATGVVGARRGRSSLVQGSVGLFHVLTGLMLVASAIIVHAVGTEDYTIKYVQR